MRLKEVFRYEVDSLLRRPTTWLYFALLILITVWMGLATFDEAPYLFNGPIRLAGVPIQAGIFGLVVSAALFGSTVLRDFEAEMDPLLFTTPLSKGEYLGGRFLAALVVNGVLLFAMPIGMVLATFLPFFGAEQIGPYRPLAYLQPFLLFALPNLVLVGALLFTIAALTRRSLVVFLGAIAFFIGYVVSLNYPDWISDPRIAALSDPLGLGVLSSLVEPWTVAENNTRLIGFPMILVWNRLFWLAVAAGILAFCHRRFRFVHQDGGRSRGAGMVTAPDGEEYVPVAVPRLAGTFDGGTPLRQTFAVVRNSLAEVALGRTFPILLLLLCGYALLTTWNVGSTVFDTSTWPVTFLVAEEGLLDRTGPIVMLLVILYAGELVWQERDAGTGEILDATPVPEGALVAGRGIALVLMVLAIHLMYLIAGLLVQALQGYTRFEVGLYLRILFGLDLLDTLLVIPLAMAIHVIVDRKAIGHLLALLAWVFPLAAPVLQIYHHGLRYGTAPAWTYSDMNGFGPSLAPYLWFKFYWVAWGLLLMAIAALFWPRGRESGWRRRWQEGKARFVAPLARVAGVALLLIVGLGGFVVYNTNILNEFLTPLTRGTAQVAYERKYRQFLDLPQPTLTDARLEVEIWPERPGVEISGSYRLVNRTGVPIDAVHLTFLDPEVTVRALAFDRPSTAELVDEESGYRIHRLESPLASGDSVTLTFDVAFTSRGFRDGKPRTDVVANGSHFDRRLIPMIGYQPVGEYTDEEGRRRFGLPPQPDIPGPDDLRARQGRWSIRNEDEVTAEAVIGTSIDQIAVTTGTLVKSWTEDDRRYFHYRSEGAISFGETTLSGRYAVRESTWTGTAGRPVALEILHHATHDWNIDRIMRGMTAALDYQTAQFGPYPYSQLRIVEHPRYGGFGRAHPGMITFSEEAFLSRVMEGEVDQPFYGTAHEVAHTWWGGMVRGGSVRGQGFLTETLANYSAMMITEKVYGMEAARRVYGFQRERYLQGRAERAMEVPVLEMEDQSYLAYRKGAIALYQLRLRIGEAAVNGALRRYFERFVDAGPPYPVARDLYDELRAATPDSLKPWVSDLLEKVVLWDVSTDSARVDPLGDGRYRVTLTVEGRKLVADSIGNETDIPMDDLVEIGVFAPTEEGKEGELLYLREHRIRTGVQTIEVVVPGRPARAGIDPRHWIIERAGDDNVVEVRGD